MTIQEYINEMIEFMLKANADLAACLEVENYEQASLIKTGLDIYLTNQSFILAEASGKKNTEVFNVLKKESDYLLEKITEERAKINL